MKKFIKKRHSKCPNCRRKRLVKTDQGYECAYCRMKYKELREQFLTTEAETSNREIAIKWWNSLSLDNQYAHTKVYYPKRQLSSLTGREIEEMFTATEPTKTRNEPPPQSAEEWIKINDIDLDMLHYIDSLGDKQLDADLLYDMMNEFAQRQGDGWVSVEDMLPEFTRKHKIGNKQIHLSDWVLVWFGEKFPTVSRYRKTSSGGYYWEEMNNANITHWRELPPPPEK